jgi:hypothetical protein
MKKEAGNIFVLPTTIRHLACCGTCVLPSSDMGRENGEFQVMTFWMGISSNNFGASIKQLQQA